MSQTIPPDGMSPSVPENLTATQLLALWADLVDTTEALVLAGLRRMIGPDGDLHEAYRRWYAEHMEEHDRALRLQAENLYRRGVRHGR